MASLKKQLRKNAPSKGAALLEYGLLVGLVAVAAISAVGTTGGKIQDTFSSASSAVASLTSEGEMAPSSPTPSEPPRMEGLDGNDLAFDIVAGRNGGGQIGFADDPRATVAMGSITVTHTGDNSLNSLKWQPSNKYSFLYINGQTGDLSSHTLTCNGIAVPTSTSENPAGSYTEGDSFTRLQWPSTRGHVFQEGETYSCIFKD